MPMYLVWSLPTKVVTVQSDPGGSGVGNVYRLGWKEECVDDADDACEVRTGSEEDLKRYTLDSVHPL